MLDLLPHEGLYCVATPNKTGGFAHRWASSHADVETLVKTLDEAGLTVFVAQASYYTPESRKAANACKVRSFWMDIDCGEGKPFADQGAGARALRDFCKLADLPLPTVVNSGNGLYSHWVLTEDILPDQWKAIATILKKLTVAFDFEVDQSRTADLASVLRPVGATHRKGEPKPVHAIHVAPPVEFSHFASLLQRAAASKKIEAPALLPPTRFEGLNDDFTSGIGDGPPCSGVEAAKHCAQLAKMRDKAGDIPEPEWYASIGVLRHCAEGEALIQEWSIGHPDYDPDKTRAKIEQHILPPTTCEHFGNVNPAGCTGCKHTGKIKTPIVLGRVLAKVAVAEVAEDRVEMPCGFTLNKEGIFYEADSLRVTAHDIYPVKVAWDDSLGFETVTFRHNTAHDGWMDFTIRTGFMRDMKTFLTALADNHVYPIGKDETKLMATYLELYTAKLKAQRHLTRLYAQMGWREEPDGLVFILGTHRFKAGVPPEEVGFAKNVPEVARSYKVAGDLETWVGTTRCFGAPKMEGHYFGFLAGGFAAPLLRMTGYDGAMVCLVGQSGVGKTLGARHIQSVYGDPGRLMMLRDDTKNSLVARLGVYGSLPVTIDEVTNIDPMDLSDLVYRITQGRDKARLSRNGTERNILNHWNTIAVVSSNSSLVEKLASVKSDASAEINRVLEYFVHANEALNREAATEVYRTINQNYGHAGRIYIQYLVDHAAEHRMNIDAISEMLVDRAGCRDEERFWVAVCAATLYSGIIAHKLGLVAHDMKALTPWVIELLRGMRASKGDVVQDCVSLLGGFLATNAANGVVMGTSAGTASLRDVGRTVVYRYEMDTGRCFISRDFLRTELARTRADFTKFRAELKSLGVLVNAEKRKTLTAGLAGYPAAQQVCWELDMRVPILGNIVARVVESPKLKAVA